MTPDDDRPEPESEPAPPEARVDGPGVASPRRRRWPAVLGTVALGVIALIATAMALIHVPYVIISPGEATALDDDILTISGAPTYAHRGNLVYLTVRVTNDDPNVWRYVLAKLDDDVSVEEREDIIGCAGYEESARLNQDLMAQSQDIAKQVALQRLGYEVTESGGRVVIVNIECGGPSEGRLQLGDVITSVDGTPVAKADDVRPLVQAHAPGETVRFTVRREDETRDDDTREGDTREGDTREVTVRLGRREGVGYAGIATQTFADASFPVDITIDTAQVSGPSAGLAFTLAIIDDLTPGDLTGGRRVAITGSIQPDGSVGIVGGVEQKAVTARNAGARLMLVPVGEAKAAREHAKGMKVVAVRTVDDALAALAANGGDPVPTAAGAPTGQ